MADFMACEQLPSGRDLGQLGDQFNLLASAVRHCLHLFCPN